jgi:hypothetical protein
LTAFLVGWFAAFLVMATWSVATPVGSAPDEASHIVKAAATVRGEFVGSPTSQEGIQTFRVPNDIAEVGDPQFSCAAARPLVAASCLPAFRERTHEVRATSGVGGYDPLYYAAVGWPSLFLTGTHAVLAMRIVSALIGSFFIGVLFWSAAVIRGRPAWLAWSSVALTPMAYFLGGVVNPNGLEIAAMAALAAVALVIVSDPAVPRIGPRVALLATSGIVAANTRSVSAIYVAVVVVAVVITAQPAALTALLRRRAVLVALGASVLGLLLAGLWTVLVASPAGFIPSTGQERPGLVRAFLHTLLQTGAYGNQFVDALGWFDVPMPSGIVVGWTAAIGAVVALVLVGARARPLIGVLVLMAALVIAPAAIQAPVAHEYGYIWQGRYGLPLFVAMVIVAGVATRGLRSRATAVRALAVSGTLSWIAQLLVVVWAYRRWSVGALGSWHGLFDGAGWQGPGGLWAAVALVSVGSLGLVAIAIAIAIRQTPRRVVEAQPS